MSRDNENQPRQLPGLGLVCGVLFFALFYVASFGPAHGLAIRQYVPAEFVGVFYCLLPKDVAWHSLQMWRRIDKGAYIDGFWFGPRRPTQLWSVRGHSEAMRPSDTILLSLAVLLTAYLSVRVHRRLHRDAAQNGFRQ